MAYIPKSLWKAVQTVSPEAIPFEYVPNDPTKCVGRYAYVAVNVSGLLDANTVATTNRWLGMSPGEIQVGDSDGTRLFDVSNTNFFTTDRNTDQRYESLPDLTLNTGIDSNKLSNFETFSYAPESQLAIDSTTGTKKYKLYIGGNLQSNLTTSAEYYPGTGQTFSNRLNEILSRPDMLGYLFYYHPPMGTPAMQQAEINQRVYAFISCMQDATQPGQVRRNLAGPNIITSTYNICLFRWLTTNSWIASASPSILSVNHHFEVQAWRFSQTPADTDVYAANVSIQVTNSVTLNSSKYTPLVYTILASAFAKQQTNISFQIPLSHGQYLADVNNLLWGQTNIVITTSTMGLQASTCSAAVVWGFLNQNYAFDACVTLSNVTKGLIVDQIPALPSGMGIPLQSASYLGLPSGIKISQSLTPTHDTFAEVFDPRCNWDGNPLYSQWWQDWQQQGPGWPDYTIQYGGSPYSFQFASYVLINPANAYLNYGKSFVGRVFDGMGIIGGFPWKDVFTAQKWGYCPGQQFQSVGQLASIPIDIWQTPRLFDHNDDSSVLGMYPNLPGFTNSDGTVNHYCRFYDYFTMTPPPSTAVDTVIRRGLVNINTRSTSVLAAAFVGMPLRDWDPANNTGYGLGALSINQATQLVQVVQNHIPPGGASNTDVFAAIPWNTPSVVGFLGATNEMDRKAVMRNSMALFTARQQIYTIIVRADAMSQEYGGGSANGSSNPANKGSVLGSAQAVFQVWRDPVSSDGTHHCFVRLCKILSL
jgi:hypothetical protein